MSNAIAIVPAFIQDKATNAVRDADRQLTAATRRYEAGVRHGERIAVRHTDNYRLRAFCAERNLQHARTEAAHIVKAIELRLRVASFQPHVIKQTLDLKRRLTIANQMAIFWSRRAEHWQVLTNQTTTPQSPTKPQNRAAGCTCHTYPTGGSPSGFDDYTVDIDQYCPRHGNAAGENAGR